MIDKKFYKNPMSALLLSAFFMPGTGQFINGQILKGMLFLLGTLLPLLWLIIYIIFFFSRNYSAIFATISGEPSGDVVPVVSIPFVISLFLVFCFFYFYGLLDAYLVAVKKMQKEEQPEK